MAAVQGQAACRYSALEPHINAEIMELHHSKHHQTYVNNYNKLLEQAKQAEAKSDAQAATALNKGLNFNGGGALPSWARQSWQVKCTCKKVIYEFQTLGHLSTCHNTHYKPHQERGRAGGTLPSALLSALMHSCQALFSYMA